MVDKCNHANDIACAMREMEDLESTVKLLHDFISKKSPDTLLVMTSDHATGGLSIGKQINRTSGTYKPKDYVWKPEFLHKIKGMVQSNIEEFFKQTSSENERKFVEGMFSTEAPKQLLDDLRAWKAKIPKNMQDLSKEQNRIGAKILSDYINDRTNTGYTSYAHVGNDVQIFADGDHQNQFNGHMENTEIGKRVFKFLGGR